jgi:hypothetical protein
MAKDKEITATPQLVFSYFREEFYHGKRQGGHPFPLTCVFIVLFGVFFFEDDMLPLFSRLS